MADLPSGYQLRAARSLIGWSQADLAKASEVDLTTIAAWRRQAMALCRGNPESFRLSLVR
jgi:transcriptional regulator with XRE-family HTH domain